MPRLTNPPRRLINTVLRERAEIKGATGVPTGDGITMEVIDAITSNGSVSIGGQTLPIIGGRAEPAVGSTVAVIWKAQEGAIGVFADSARKAQFAPVLPVGGSVVEELFIAKDATTGITDVYFRNKDQVTALKLSAIALNNVGLPRNVMWGLGTDRFMVFDSYTTVDKPVRVVKLNRVANKAYPIGKQATATIESAITANAVVPALGVTVIVSQYFLDDRGHLLIVGQTSAGATSATPVDVYDLTTGGAVMASLSTIAPTPPTIVGTIAFLQGIVPPGWTVLNIGGVDPIYATGHGAFITATKKGQVTQWIDTTSSGISSALFVPPPFPDPGITFTAAVDVFFATVLVGNTKFPAPSGVLVLSTKTTNSSNENAISHRLDFFDAVIAHLGVQIFQCAPHHLLFSRISNPPPPAQKIFTAFIRDLVPQTETSIAATNFNAQGPVFIPIALLYAPGIYYTNFVSGTPFPSKERDFLTTFKIATDPSLAAPLRSLFANLSTLKTLPTAIAAAYPGWGGDQVIPGNNAQSIAFQLINDGAIHHFV